MSGISSVISVNGGRKPIERLRDARAYLLYAFVAVLLILMAWGLFVRFEGLRSPPLVDDEYFTVTGVQYILEKGVPEFPTGGYYMRGLPLQYLQAASVRLFGDNEFGHRLPAALFGVVTLLLVFLYARIFLPRWLAVTCVAMLAVSSWQIEFGRFARMYAGFQCISVAFFLAYHRAYFGGNRRLTYLPHALALMAVFCHELGVFLLPFLFLPLLIEKNASDGVTPLRNRWIFTSVSCATTLVGLGCWKLESWLRDFHVQQNLPDGFHVAPADSLGPFGAYTVLPITGNILGAFLMIALVAGLFIFFRVRSKSMPQSRLTALDMGLLLLLLSVVLHLFAVSVCIAAVLFIRYQPHRDLFKDRGKLALLILSALTACAWVAYAIYDQSWRERMLATNFPRALRILFFGWPDFYQPIIWPWLASLPLLTVIFLVALAWHFIQQSRQGITSILGHPLIIILVAFGSIAVIDPIVQPMLNTTRYSYYIYPFFILLIVMACYEVVRRTTRRVIGSNTQVLLSGFMAMGLFAVGEDFNLRQLVDINSPEVAFRTGRFKRYEHHWYWRRDGRSPAEFLNAHRNEVDALVISMHARTSLFYLHRQMDFAFYCSREGMDAPRNSRAGEDAAWYGQIARSKGKVELWTGRPLLGTEQELRVYTDGMQSLYLLRQVAPDQQSFDINHVWPDRLVSWERVFLSSDGSTEVVRISLGHPAQRTRPVSVETQTGAELLPNR